MPDRDFLYQKYPIGTFIPKMLDRTFIPKIA